MKKAVMYGAGNIGRGFIGQLFSESGYEVIFIDINSEIIDALNKEGKYPVRILNAQGAKDIWVRNVSGVNARDTEKVAQAIASADIMATAIGVNVLPLISGIIASGLKKRWESNRRDFFNILICENLLEADKYLEKLICQELGKEEIPLFYEKTGLVETSIGRMVPVMTSAMQDGNILRVCVEEFCELPVDKNGFKGAIADIKNMIPFTPFSFMIQRKLFIHNMGHAITAYLGNLKGYSYIAEAIFDPYIKKIVKSAMENSAVALSKVHGIPLIDIQKYADDLVFRFGNRQLGDTVKRVGKDVKRKLSPHDRLVGAARLCESNGVNPEYICLGIAAAIKFEKIMGELDGHTIEIGPEIVLEKICQIPEDSPLYFLTMSFYNKLDETSDFVDIIDFTEALVQESNDKILAGT
jgi:mannitol-1-phosphate 5-dehydrogenase